MPSLLSRLASAFPGFRGRPTVPAPPPVDPLLARVDLVKQVKEQLENTPRKPRPSTEERVPTNYHGGVAGKVWFLPYLDSTTKDTAEIRAAMRAMRKDGYVKAAWEPQILTVASEDWQVQPSEAGNAGAEEQAAFCKSVIEDYLAGGIVTGVRAVCAPLGSDGHSVGEKVWAVAERGRLEGKVVLANLKARDCDGSDARLQGDAFGNVTGVQALRGGSQQVWPIRDFVFSRYMTVFDEPLGEAAFRPAYGPYWMRDTVRKLRAIHHEKRMAGTLMGTYQDDDQKGPLEAALRAAKTATWLSVPEGCRVEAMALSTASEPDYKSFDESLRDEIVTAIAFATLQIIQGNVPDARGDSKVQKSMSDLGPWLLMTLVSEAFNKQVFPDLIDFNFPFPAGGAYPKLTFGAVSNSELLELAQVVQAAIGIGLNPSRKHYAKALSVQEADPNDPDDGLNPQPPAGGLAPDVGGGFGGPGLGGGGPAMLPPALPPGGGTGGGMVPFSEGLHYEFREPVKWSRQANGSWRSSGGRVLSDAAYQRHAQRVAERSQAPAAQPPQPAGIPARMVGHPTESGRRLPRLRAGFRDRAVGRTEYEAAMAVGGAVAGAGRARAMAIAAKVAEADGGRPANLKVTKARRPKAVPAPTPERVSELATQAAGGDRAAATELKAHAAADADAGLAALAKAPPETAATIRAAFESATARRGGSVRATSTAGRVRAAVGNFLSGLVGSSAAGGVAGRVGGLVRGLAKLGGRALAFGVKSLARFAKFAAKAGWEGTKGAGRVAGKVVGSDTVKPFLYWAGAVAAGAAIMAAPVLAVNYGVVPWIVGVAAAPAAVAGTVVVGRKLGRRAADAGLASKGQGFVTPHAEHFGCGRVTKFAEAKDVALAGVDGKRADQLLSAAQKDVARLFHEKCRAATERLLASPNPMAATVLFDDAELGAIGSGLGRVIATADLLGRARIRRRAEMAEKRATTFAEGPPDPAPYGYCPDCREPGVSAERRINGNAHCPNGHAYPRDRAKYSCVMLPLAETPLGAKLRELGATVADEDLGEDGREDDPHVTARYGLHTSDPAEVRRLAAGVGPVRLTLGKVSAFRGAGSGKPYDVLFAEVDGPDLRGLHARLGGVPHTDTHADYHPHATIAYVKAGKADEYLKKFSEPLKLTATVPTLEFSDAKRNATVIPLTGAETFAEQQPDDPYHDFAEPVPPLAPLKALEFIRSRVPALDPGPDRYGSRLDRHATTLAIASDEVLLDRIKQAIADELMGRGDATPDIQAVLDRAGVGATEPQYAEMVARTNAMAAYNQGSSDELRSPEMAEAFPAWEYLGVLDTRTGDDHRPKIGKFYPSSADFAEVRGPRLWNCRCTSAPVHRSQMGAVRVEERW